MDDLTSLKVNAAVREAVDQRFEKEKSLLRETMSLSVKIIAACFAGLIAILTLVGVQTWMQIEGHVFEVIDRKVSELVESEDGSSSVKNMVNELYVDLIVQSILSKKWTRSDVSAQDRFGRRYLIGSRASFAVDIYTDPSDTEKIIQRLLNPMTSLEKFTDALLALDYIAAVSIDTEKLAVVGQLLTADESDIYSWMRKRPDKRNSIVENLNPRIIASALMNVIANKSESEVFRMAAISRLKLNDTHRENLYSGTVYLIEHESSRIIRRELIALAYMMNPNGSEIKGIIRSFLSSDQAADADYFLMGVAAIPFEYTALRMGERNSTRSFQAEALLRLLAKGGYFDLRTNGNRQLSSIYIVFGSDEMELELGEINAIPEFYNRYSDVLRDQNEAAFIDRVKNDFKISKADEYRWPIRFDIRKTSNIEIEAEIYGDEIVLQSERFPDARLAVYSNGISVEWSEKGKTQSAKLLALHGSSYQLVFSAPFSAPRGVYAPSDVY